MACNSISARIDLSARHRAADSCPSSCSLLPAFSCRSDSRQTVPRWIAPLSKRVSAYSRYLRKKTNLLLYHFVLLLI